MTGPALRVGLTGGVAAGKSTVARLFAERGAPVLSADAVSHDLTAPGAPLLEDLRAAFGTEVFAADGALDRRALANRVFADDDARARLEALLHPPILAALAERAAAIHAPYCVIEIPLLESRHVGPLVDRVLVVDAPPAAQLARLRARDHLDAAAAQQRLDAQMDRAARLAFADDVLENDGDPAALAARVDELHALYTRVARRGEWDA
jgi:dephospho-CoA kinase